MSLLIFHWKHNRIYTIDKDTNVPFLSYWFFGVEFGLFDECDRQPILLDKAAGFSHLQHLDIREY